MAAGLVLLTVTAVTACVVTVSRAGARLERRMDADRAACQVAERLRTLPFCAHSYPQATATGGRASDLVAAVFPHADLARNTASARYALVAGDEGESAGSFVTLSVEDGVQVTCVARFLAGPGGSVLGPESLGGWDAESASAPPSGTLSVVLGVPGGGRPAGVRAVGAPDATHLGEDDGGPLMRRMAIHRLADRGRDDGVHARGAARRRGPRGNRPDGCLRLAVECRRPRGWRRRSGAGRHAGCSRVPYRRRRPARRCVRGRASRPAAILRARSRWCTTMRLRPPRPYSSCGTRRGASCGATRPAPTSPTTSPSSTSRMSSPTDRSWMETAWDQPTGRRCVLRGCWSRPPSGRPLCGGPSKLRWVLHEQAAVDRGLRDACRSSGGRPGRHIRARRRRRRARRAIGRGRGRVGAAGDGGRGECARRRDSFPALAAVGPDRDEPREAIPAQGARGGSPGRRRLVVAGDAWPRVGAQVETSAGRARRRDDLVFELRSESWAMGVTCAGDADVAAPLTV